MNDSAPECTVSADRLAALERLAVDCREELKRLTALQHSFLQDLIQRLVGDYLLAYREREQQLIARLMRIQSAVEDLLPQAEDDATAASADPEEPPPPSNGPPAPPGNSSRVDPGLDALGVAYPPSSSSLRAGIRPPPTAAQDVVYGLSASTSRYPTPQAGSAKPAAAPPSTAQVEDNKDRIVTTRYPAIRPFYQASNRAIKLLAASDPTNADVYESLPPAIRQELEMMKTTAPVLRDHLYNLGEKVEAGEKAIAEKARTLLNSLTKLDKHLEPAFALSGHLESQLRVVRNHLWEFIRQGTNDLFKEIAPPPNTNVTAWVKLNNYSEEKYLEFQPVNVTGFPRDHIVKTLRPGYVKFKEEDRKQVDYIIKALVQIASPGA